MVCVAVACGIQILQLLQYVNHLGNILEVNLVGVQVVIDGVLLRVEGYAPADGCPDLRGPAVLIGHPDRCIAVILDGLADVKELLISLRVRVGDAAVSHDLLVVIHAAEEAGRLIDRHGVDMAVALVAQIIRVGAAGDPGLIVEHHAVVGRVILLDNLRCVLQEDIGGVAGGELDTQDFTHAAVIDQRQIDRDTVVLFNLLAYIVKAGIPGILRAHDRDRAGQGRFLSCGCIRFCRGRRRGCGICGGRLRLCGFLLAGCAAGEHCAQHHDTQQHAD